MHQRHKHNSQLPHKHLPSHPSRAAAVDNKRVVVDNKRVVVHNKRAVVDNKRQIEHVKINNLMQIEIWLNIIVSHQLDKIHYSNSDVTCLNNIVSNCI